MSDLTDALDKQQIKGAGGLTTDEAAYIREAARMIANPNYEAAQLVKIGDPCDIDGERDQANEWITPRDLEALVDAALTPPEDDE